MLSPSLISCLNLCSLASSPTGTGLSCREAWFASNYYQRRETAALPLPQISLVSREPRAGGHREAVQIPWVYLAFLLHL